MSDLEPVDLETDREKKFSRIKKRSAEDIPVQSHSEDDEEGEEGEEGEGEEERDTISDVFGIDVNDLDKSGSDVSLDCNDMNTRDGQSDTESNQENLEKQPKKSKKKPTAKLKEEMTKDTVKLIPLQEDEKKVKLIPFKFFGDTGIICLLVVQKKRESTSLKDDEAQEGGESESDEDNPGEQHEDLEALLGDDDHYKRVNKKAAKKKKRGDNEGTYVLVVGSGVDFLTSPLCTYLVSVVEVNENKKRQSKYQGELGYVLFNPLEYRLVRVEKINFRAKTPTFDNTIKYIGESGFVSFSDNVTSRKRNSEIWEKLRVIFNANVRKDPMKEIDFDGTGGRFYNILCCVKYAWKEVRFFNIGIIFGSKFLTSIKDKEILAMIYSYNSLGINDIVRIIEITQLPENAIQFLYNRFDEIGLCINERSFNNFSKLYWRLNMAKERYKEVLISCNDPTDEMWTLDDIIKECLSQAKLRCGSVSGRQYIIECKDFKCVEGYAEEINFMLYSAETFELHLCSDTSTRGSPYFNVMSGVLSTSQTGTIVVCATNERMEFLEGELKGEFPNITFITALDFFLKKKTSFKSKANAHRVFNTLIIDEMCTMGYIGVMRCFRYLSSAKEIHIFGNLHSPPYTYGAPIVDIYNLTKIAHNGKCILIDDIDSKYAELFTHGVLTFRLGLYLDTYKEVVAFVEKYQQTTVFVANGKHIGEHKKYLSQCRYIIPKTYKEVNDETKGVPMFKSVIIDPRASNRRQIMMVLKACNRNEIGNVHIFGGEKKFIDSMNIKPLPLSVFDFCFNKSLQNPGKRPYIDGWDPKRNVKKPKNGDHITDESDYSK